MTRAKIMRRIPIMLTLALGIGLAGTGVALAAPTPASTSAGPTVATKQMHAQSVVAGPLSSLPVKPGADWGKITWSKQVAGATANSPATAVACSLYVGPVTLPNGLLGALETETVQTCSGPFGVQQTQTRMQRSSWSGWRWYSATGYSETTASIYLYTNWEVDCGGYGQGTYDYRELAKGYATALGWSGYAYYAGSQSQRFACGT
jgi:hypothetical protein